MELPYLTRDLPGIGGRIKQFLDDFQVQEIALYPASGQGTHVYFQLRKAGLPTPGAIERLARFMGVRPHDIGVAGLKDAQAVTTQWLSLEYADVNKLLSYHDSQMQILQISRHTNKLRPGHLAGNRFMVRIRGAGAAQVEAASKTLEVLTRRGVPNYFGEQRFGARGDTGELGRALIVDDPQEFVAILLGRSRPVDPSDCRAAREAFDAGFYDRALKLWPRHYADQRRALAAYSKKKHAGAAIAAVDKRMRRLFVSAFQSTLFNEVLARRIDTIDRVIAGDMAEKHDSGGVFLVEDAEREQPRAERFEISPTGPIPGYRASLAQGEPGKMEREVMAAHGMTQESFQNAGSLRIKGSRRPLRFQLIEPALKVSGDEHGEFLELSFVLTAGCYATVALREIMKEPAKTPALDKAQPQAEVEPQDEIAEEE